MTIKLQIIKMTFNHKHNVALLDYSNYSNSWVGVVFLLLLLVLLNYIYLTDSFIHIEILINYETRINKAMGFSVDNQNTGNLKLNGYLILLR